MFPTKSNKEHWTMLILLSEFNFQIETKKSDSLENWMEELLYLRHQYLMRCPEAYKADFETRMNAIIWSKLNIEEPGKEDHPLSSQQIKILRNWHIQSVCRNAERQFLFN